MTDMIPARADIGPDADRRRFLKAAGGGAATAGTLALLAACSGSDDPTPTPSGSPTPTPSGTASPSPTPSPTAAFSETAAFSFVLNIAYLQAQFFARAAFGTPLADGLLGGSGTRGEVTGGRQISFADPLLAQYAREIATDEVANVGYLRRMLGGNVIAQPAINIDGGASGAFTAAMRAAGVVATTATFDPYGSDDNFLLSAFFLKDAAVTAWRGVIAAISPANRSAGGGLHATQAYHAGLIRSELYVRGATTATLRTYAGNISDARDQLDGVGSDLDQPIAGSTDVSNVTPADSDGFGFIRSPQQVLNILYLTRDAVVGGPFFPAGVNGELRTSAAS